MTKKKLIKSQYNTFHLDEMKTKDGIVQVPIPVFYNEGIDVEDKELYFVYLLRETNILTNMLLSILYYKEYVGQAWPRTIVFSSKSRFSKCRLEFGEETVMASDLRFRVMDALYMSLYGPIPDLHENKRTPTIFNGKRKSAENPNEYPINSLRIRKTDAIKV